MSASTRFTNRCRFLIVLGAAMHALPHDRLAAQSRRITGVVADSATGAALEGARVVAQAEGGTAVEGWSDGRGRFRMLMSGSGSLSLTVSRIGYRPARVMGATNSDEPIQIRMVEQPFQLAPLVVSASLVRETQLIAPAAVSVVPAATIRTTVTTTALDYLRDVPGIAFAQKGLFTNTFSARGPRNVTAQDLLVLHDYRYSAIPVLGFNTGLFIPATQDDLERIEVVRGPGAVIYGPNSRRGVVHLITRSPLGPPENVVSVGGGERALFDASARFSRKVGERFGVKLSGRFARGDEWGFSDPAEVAARQQAIGAGADPATLLIGRRLSEEKVWQAEARGDWQLRPDAILSTTAGISEATGIETSGEAGASQAQGWRYTYLQSRLTGSRLFANVMYNLSDAGTTYSLRSGGLFVDESRLFAAQLQYRLEAGPARFLVGSDFRSGIPRTGGTLNGRFEDDDNLRETGAYLHASAAVSPRVELSGALRLDHHNRLRDEFFLSPRAAVVVKPAPNHALRASWSRSFAQPTTRDLFPDLSLGPLGPLPFAIRLTGSAGRGFTFDRSCGGLCMRVPAAFAGGQVVSLPASAPLLWPAVVAFMQQQGLDLSPLPAPTAADVGTVLALLNPASGGFTPVTDASIQDVEPVRRVVETALEAGYKGFLTEGLFATVDLHYTRASRVFATTSTVNTPNVFFDPATLAVYLGQFMPAEAAQQTAAAIASLPLGTISPREVPGADLLIFQPAVQGGKYDYWGADVALSWRASERVGLSGSYSFTSKDSTGLGDVGGFLLFQAPRHTGHAGAEWHHEPRGVRGYLRGRAVSAFSVRTPAYIGRVESYVTLDAGAGVRLPVGKETWLSLDVLNALDHVHTEFTGAPPLGRLLTSRVRLSF
jgi:iron complex outermembrane receptor protein